MTLVNDVLVMQHVSINWFITRNHQLKRELSLLVLTLLVPK